MSWWKAITEKVEGKVNPFSCEKIIFPVCVCQLSGGRIQWNCWSQPRAGMQRPVRLTTTICSHSNQTPAQPKGLCENRNQYSGKHSRMVKYSTGTFFRNCDIQLWFSHLETTQPLKGKEGVRARRIANPLRSVACWRQPRWPTPYSSSELCVIVIIIIDS